MENIMLPLFAASVTKDEYSEKEIHAVALMERTGIKGLGNKYPSNIWRRSTKDYPCKGVNK
jgi:hypothetical protein